MVEGGCGWKTWGDGFDSTGAYWFNYFIYILLALPMGCCASWFVHIYSKAAARSGLSEMKVMLGGFILKKFLGIRTVMIKALGVILGVASGLHIGKLGPLVHIACCWGNIFARRFTKYNTNEVKKREILSASVAAGVSAAFGSPIGGVLFSLESLSSYFPPQTMWRSFWCSITAALCLGYIDPFQTGKLVQFGVTSNANQWHWRELPLFALIGCFGGFVGASFNHLNIQVNLYRKKHKWLYLHPVREVALLTLITAVVNYPNIYLRGSASGLLAQLFTNCRDVTPLTAYDTSAGDNVHNALCEDESANDSPLMISLLLCASITNFFFTAFTYGCNVPGGVFMPGLVIGASIGRMVGWGLQLNFLAQGPTGFFSECIDKTYCVSPGLYAIIGAAAVLTGITRLTVSLAIVIYEVTGGLEYIAPIMITIVCAKWSADALGKQGLYAMRINKLHGYPWIDAYAEMELIGPAMDIMSRQPVCLNVYGGTLYSLKALLAKYPYHGFPIIDNNFDQLIYGYIARSDLELLIEQNKEADAKNPFVPVHFSHDPPPYPTPHFLDFSGNVDKYVVKILPHTPIDRVLGLFQGLGLRYVLVTSHKGQLLGIIKKKDVLVYIREHNGGKNTELV
jgi:chloride channel 3/4/5